MMKRATLSIGINRYQDAGISRFLCVKKDALALELSLRDRCRFVVTSLVNNQDGKAFV